MDDFAYQWPYISMTQPREIGLKGLNTISALSAQFETLSRKLDALVAESTQGITVTCDYCADNHPSHQCTISYRPIQYGSDYLNHYAYPDYHQDWGYHPDSTWSYNYEDQYYAPSPTYPLEFSCPPPLQQEKNSSLEDFVSKIIADREEMMRSQETSTQYLNNQMEQLINTSTSGLQNTWIYDMESDTDDEPEPNLQLDEPQDIERRETSREKENEAIKDLPLNDKEDDPILLVPQMPSPSKFKNPVSFAKSCPLGSHIIGKALYDIRARTTLQPWWDEREKIEEEPVVFDKIQCLNLITNTTEEAPSFLTVVIRNPSTKRKLGELDIRAPTAAKPLTITLLLMDGGFLNFRKGIG